MKFFSGTNILAYADNWGEKLAWFFGITSPKYYWELEEFKKMSAEEEELKKKEAEENFGWTEKGKESQVIFNKYMTLTLFGWHGAGGGGRYFYPLRLFKIFTWHKFLVEFA